MSTTFGVLKPTHTKINNLEDWEELEEKTVPVALRSFDGKLRVTWLNEIAPLLPSTPKVYPLDNTAQGIETIEDLLAIEKPVNPYNAFGRKPHPMDFDTKEEYLIRIGRWRRWEEKENNKNHEKE